MNQLSLLIAPIVFCVSTISALAESPIKPGDRIAIVGNTFADQLRIHGYLETLLLNHTRDNPVSIRNLGWGGDMLSARDRPTGFPSEESTLTAHKTDVIIACFGMGESFAGEKGVDEFKGQIRAFIKSHEGKKYNGTSEVRLVLVSPIACEDIGDLSPAHEKRLGELRTYTQAMRDVASDSSIPFVDLFEPSAYLMNEAVGPDLTNNGIHLNAYGYWAVGHSFFQQLTIDDRSSDRWVIRIDCQAVTGSGRGVDVADLSSDQNGIRFQVTEKSAPKLRPPTRQRLPSQLAFARDTLIVENLAPGKYQLLVDDDPVASASAEDWGKGVPIDSSPAHEIAEQYRAVINNKNLQFTYSWKALNQVHIVGERRTSPSGKALPAEVVEFDKLANQRDKELRSGIKLKTRSWQLSRVTDPASKTKNQ